MDLLVALYRLPPLEPWLAALDAHGIRIRRNLAHERHAMLDWVVRAFPDEGDAWQSECSAAFAATPTRCFVAIDNGAPVGFACYDATARGFFGPTGTAASARGKGVGAALLLTALEAMRADGYGYAAIGGTNEAVSGFYRKVAGAVPIPDSTPGLYDSPLGGRESP